MEKAKKPKNDNTVITSYLRDKLKSIVNEEIDKIPEYIEGLTPKEKLDFVIKVLPYVSPKVTSVHFTEGEPYSFNF